MRSSNDSSPPTKKIRRKISDGLRRTESTSREGPRLRVLSRPGDELI